MKVILTTLQSLRNLLITQDSLQKYIVLLLFIISCNYNIKNNDGYVARLGDDFLSIDEVKNQIPNNLTTEDSLKMANKIIEEWATSKLLILNAQINLTETERIEIESKSEKYRENLIISEYKNKISNNNPDTLISKNEIEFFFNAKMPLFHFHDLPLID